NAEGSEERRSRKKNTFTAAVIGMNEHLKNLLRATFKRFGYRLSRWQSPNRFQAMEEALAILKGVGYAPKKILDAGANKGTWTQMAMRVFPDAQYHLIEPQPACRHELEKLSKSFPNLSL